jgi:hypothetical protein
MAVDVHVEIGMPDGKDVEDAYRVRMILAGDVERAWLDKAKVVRAHEVGGGVNFEPLVVDATYEAKNTQDAMLAVAVIAASLLAQGFTVAPSGGILVVREHGTVTVPKPGGALISVVAPLGTP